MIDCERPTAFRRRRDRGVGLFGPVSPAPGGGVATGRCGEGLAAWGSVVRGMVLVGLAGLAPGPAAAGPVPPKPATYVEDRAGFLDGATVQRLRLRLEQFERETSNQIVVATFPKLPGGEALEDFTVRTAEAWGVGRAATDNGLVLFVFRDDRKIRIEVGYGLEGRIPDSIARRIIANEMTPRFRAGDPAGGISAAVEALIAATKGEYTGTGRTLADDRGQPWGGLIALAVFIVVMVLLILFLRRLTRNTVYQRSGRRSVWIPPGGGWTGGGNVGRGWSGGGGFGGGGGHSGGGGFSSGGGSFGGGGASGGW